MTRCYICKHVLDERKDTRYCIERGPTLCSNECLFDWRMEARAV